MPRCRARAEDQRRARAEAECRLEAHKADERREYLGAWRTLAQRNSLLKRRAESYAVVKSTRLTARTLNAWRERSAKLNEARTFAEQVNEAFTHLPLPSTSPSPSLMTQYEEERSTSAYGHRGGKNTLASNEALAPNFKARGRLHVGLL
jgi:hypothetical protein